MCGGVPGSCVFMTRDSSHALVWAAIKTSPLLVSAMAKLRAAQSRVANESDVDGKMSVESLVDLVTTAARATSVMHTLRTAHIGDNDNRTASGVAVGDDGGGGGGGGEARDFGWGGGVRRGWVCCMHGAVKL